MFNIQAWVNSLKSNEIQLIVGIIGASATLFAAFVAVSTAFKQIARQFEHKIVYEGWKDFQKNLFNFSNTLMNYDTTVQWLTYFVSSQDNNLVNGGNKIKHRQEKWQELVDTYSNLQKAYVGFLRSYENHEVIFLPLRKMKLAFTKEYRERVDDRNQEFMQKIFPEMYGMSYNLTLEEAKKEIEDYWYKMTEISAFLDDFRIELQNNTIGKILKKKVPKREVDPGYKILTKGGYIIKKPTLKQVLRRTKANNNLNYDK